ncbi:hypothetical protein BDW59DRAFT_142264 [Aspergillus cavernicola]|uniref:Uncharacterized protein n=1 Tax=Aspergillus cavernicola TaxID=176166 RepID=A0ABR4IN39_9EURO
MTGMPWIYTREQWAHIQTVHRQRAQQQYQQQQQQEGPIEWDTQMTEAPNMPVFNFYDQVNPNYGDMEDI